MMWPFRRRREFFATVPIARQVREAIRRAKDAREIAGDPVLWFQVYDRAAEHFDTILCWRNLRIQVLGDVIIFVNFVEDGAASRLCGNGDVQWSREHEHENSFIWTSGGWEMSAGDSRRQEFEEFLRLALAGVVLEVA